MTQRIRYDFPGAERSFALHVADARPEGCDLVASSTANGRLPAAHVYMSFDPEFAPPAMASAEEIRYAQELRRQLRLRYRERPSAPESPWCVGAD
jgi:hypothetical protein